MRMNQIIFIIAVLIGSGLLATEIEWVDNQIETIRSPRKGIKITEVTNPFIFLDKNKKEKKPAISLGAATIPKLTAPVELSISESVKKKNYQLTAIMNKSAMIDESWYKKGDRVDNYTIVEIDKNSVTLRDGSKEMFLSTNSQRQNLKFKNK